MNSIIEIDYPVLITDLFSYQAGIWWCDLTPGTGTITGSDGLIGYWGTRNTVEYNNIKTLTAFLNSYTKYEVLSGCLADDMSFYVDGSIIYIHFENHEPMLDKITKAGNAHGFVDYFEKYYNDLYYDPRVSSVPNISLKKDPFNFGIQSFSNFSVSFINEYGYFDNSNNDDIYSQTIRHLVGNIGDDYEDYHLINEGYIEDFSINRNSFSVKVADKRKALTQKLPLHTFNLIDYPNMSVEDSKLGQKIPMSWGGPFLYAPCFCMDTDETYFANHDFIQFKLLDCYYYPMLAEPTIYKKVDETYIEITPTSIDLVNGTVTIAKSDCADEDDNISSLYFTGHGADPAGYYDEGVYVPGEYNNPLYQILYLMLDVANVPYNNILWDIGNPLIDEYMEMTEISDSLNPLIETSIYIKDDIDLKSIIEKICRSSNMMFYVKTNGKYSLKAYFPERVSKKTFLDDEWLSEPQFDYESNDFLSSVTIKYKTNYEKDQYNEIPDDSYKRAVLERYRKEKSKSIETYSTNETSVNALSGDILERQQYILERVKRTCHITSLYYNNGMTNYDVPLELMDFVRASHHRYGAVEVLKTYEIIGININIDNSKVELEFMEVR